MSGSGASQRATSEDIKAKAAEAGEQLKNQGKAQLDSYRGTAADERKVAQSARLPPQAGKIRTAPACPYVSDIAQSMVDLADNLRGKASTSWSAR